MSYSNTCETKCTAAVISVGVICLSLLMGQCAWLNCSTPEKMCISFPSGHNRTACLEALQKKELPEPQAQQTTGAGVFGG